MERTCDFNPLDGTRRPLIRRMLNKLAATRGANAKPVRTRKPWPPQDTRGLTAGYLIRRRVGLPLGRGGMSGGVSVGVGLSAGTPTDSAGAGLTSATPSGANVVAWR